MTIQSSSSCVFSALFVFSNLLLVSLAAEIPKDTHFVGQKVDQNPNPGADLIAAPSVAVKSYKTQSLAPRSSASSSNRRYGYPYLIAPTLTPNINVRSDDDENEAIVAQVKPFGSKLAASEEVVKKGHLKKYKAPFIYGASRRQGFDDEEETSAERRLRTYREPTYRNFDELESTFRPRRIDISVPYSGYDYSLKSSRRPEVSPRDPYLSPSNEPAEGFYPSVPKLKSYSAPYSQRGREIPSYGAGRYEDPSPYHDDDYTHSGYGKGPYDSPSKYPSTGGHYDYQEDYAIESNKPITGDIRKRLLDYAGASDLYEGEPDYLQQVPQNKHKYGHAANDYYAYGEPGYKSSYRDYPHVESKVSLVKKTRS